MSLKKSSRKYIISHQPTSPSKKKREVGTSSSIQEGTHVRHPEEWSIKNDACSQYAHIQYVQPFRPAPYLLTRYSTPELCKVHRYLQKRNYKKSNKTAAHIQLSKNIQENTGVGIPSIRSTNSQCEIEEVPLNTNQQSTPDSIYQLSSAVLKPLWSARKRSAQRTTSLSR
jgi:hypothetical protein